MMSYVLLTQLDSINVVILPGSCALWSVSISSTYHQALSCFRSWAKHSAVHALRTSWQSPDSSSR